MQVFRLCSADSFAISMYMSSSKITSTKQPSSETDDADGMNACYGALQIIFFIENPRLLWKWVRGSRSHFEFVFVWKIVPK